MLSTDRLLLRRWRDSDREPFAALNADPEVMRYFPSTRTRAESDAMVDRLDAAIEADGFGLWAVERRDSGAFIGFVGLSRPSFDPGSPSRSRSAGDSAAMPGVTDSPPRPPERWSGTRSTRRGPT